MKVLTVMARHGRTAGTTGYDTDSIYPPLLLVVFNLAVIGHPISCQWCEINPQPFSWHG